MCPSTLFRSAKLWTALIVPTSAVLFAADQPQWGEAWSRNMTSPEIGLPSQFDLDSGLNLKWSVPLGTQTHCSPIIAEGRVYIGTNNENPRDPAQTGDRGVLLCLDEKDGSMLWQLVTPKRTEDQYFDWPKTGMSSPATIVQGKVYTLDNRGTVLCLDPLGMANGNDGPFTDEGKRMLPHAALPPTFKAEQSSETGAVNPNDADILWELDLPSEAGIWPHDGAHSSILVHGDFLYLNSGTGVDNSHRAIRLPDAPALLAIEKSTGRLVGRDFEKISPNTFHANWSSPSLMKIDGREVLIFAGGDGIVRAFEPLSQMPQQGTVAALKMLGAYDLDPSAPKEDVHKYVQNRQQSPSDIYGMPVIIGTRMYVAGGGDIWWGKNEAWLKCVEWSFQNGKLESHELWSFPLDKHTMSTPAVSNGLVFVTDTSRNIHCVDAETGQGLWKHETKGDFWASPLVADGKVYAGTRKGDFWILSATREKNVLHTFDFKRPVSATATAANGVLYVATMDHLYAFKQGALPVSPRPKP